MTDRPTLFKRFLQKLASALADGLGPHLLATALLSLAVVCLRAAFVMSAPSKDTTQAFDNLLNAKHEPMREEGMPSLAAAITSKIELPEDQGTPTRQLLDELYFRFQSLYAEKSNFLPTPPRTQFVDQLGCKGTFGTDKDKNRLLKIDFKKELVPAPPRTKGVGPAFVKSNHEFAVQLPSTLNTSRTTAPRFTYAQSKASSIALFSCLIDKRVDPTSSDIKAIYFISTDGLFAITPPSALDISTPSAQAKLPAHRLFTSASYFSAALGSASEPQMYTPNPYTSLPYLDLFGAGLVRTSCYPVFAKETIKPRLKEKDGPEEPRLDGVFCIDLGIPKEAVLEAFKNLPLLDTHLVRIRDDSLKPGEANARVEVCLQDNTTRCFPEKLGVSPEDIDALAKKLGVPLGVVDALAKKLGVPLGVVDAFAKKLGVPPERVGKFDAFAREWLKQTKDPSTAGQSNIKQLTSSSPYYYGAAVWKSSQALNERYVAIFTRQTKSSQTTVITLAAVAALLVIGALIVTARSRLKQNKRTESALIRGLQTGILRCDENNNITGANDRAEEILHTKLPRLGLSGSLFNWTKPQNFTEFLTEDIYIKQSGDGAKLTLDNLKKTTLDDINKTRRQRLSTNYWARIVSGNGIRWIRVTGSPIITPGQKTHSFGLIDVATPEEKEVLEEKCKSAAEANSALASKANQAGA